MKREGVLILCLLLTSASLTAVQPNKGLDDFSALLFLAHQSLFDPYSVEAVNYPDAVPVRLPRTKVSDRASTILRIAATTFSPATSLTSQFARYEPRNARLFYRIAILRI